MFGRVLVDDGHSGGPRLHPWRALASAGLSLIYLVSTLAWSDPESLFWVVWPLLVIVYSWALWPKYANPRAWPWKGHLAAIILAAAGTVLMFFLGIAAWYIMAKPV